MIRPAQASDVPALYDLMAIIWQDMEFEPYVTLDSQTFKEAMVQHLLDTKQKYNYQNCWVYQSRHTGQIQGLVLGYPGHLEPRYDRLIEQYFGNHTELEDFSLTRESRDDEWYIDMLVVDPQARGLGIATALVKHLESVHSEGTVLGLNCDLVNPRAKALYHRLGFEVRDQVTFSGHDYHHMQKTVTP
ncbi:GNAT family N-acetyltransferase [uncultured Abiotrophia sp.]|uniref:GNAT family N-acetyltransferase n=1 Tax=uncultured Abiotrophia sp. TaxID=316094 RepID=UPI0028ED9CAB|nr:GNAT family N-acetyltransferase [uncultured Abiotrophia sp.]